MFKETIYQAGKASAATAPVEDVGVNVQGETGQPDVADETLFFHLLQRRNRLFDDLQQSYRCTFQPFTRSNTRLVTSSGGQAGNAIDLLRILATCHSKEQNYTYSRLKV